MKPIILLLLLPFYTFAQQKILVSKTINTDKHTEYAPTISADGQRMVFQSDNNRYRVWYLYESTFQKTGSKNGQIKGKWSKPRPIESINQFGEKPSEANGFQTDFIAAPSLSADGNTLFFTATFHSGLGGRDLYYVTRQSDGGWSRPRNVGPPINTAGNEDFASISPDGQQLYFARPLNTSQAGEGCYQLYVAKKISGHWQTPLKLPNPINTGCEKCVRVQADGVTLLFSSVRQDGTGGFDLYKAVLSVNGRYWESIKAIKEANSTQFDKFATVVEPHNTVYFNSQGRKSPNIFKLSSLPDYLRLQKFAEASAKVLAQKNGEKNTSNTPLAANLKLYWYNPYSGESEVIRRWKSNAQTGSFALRLRTKHQYRLEASAEGYQSTQVAIDLRQSNGGGYPLADIVLLPKTTSKPVLALNNAPKTTTSSPKKATQQKTQPKREHKRQPKRQPKRQKGNKVKATLPNPAVYRPSKQIAIGKNRQIKKTTPVVAEPKAIKAIKDIQNIPQALAWRFPRIGFAYKSFALTNGNKMTLKNAVLLLQKFPKLKLRISGYTDDLGTPEVNQRLSLERAKAVQQHLIQQGIAPARLVIKGYGETKPLNKENRAANRRVELQLIEGDE